MYFYINKFLLRNHTKNNIYYRLKRFVNNNKYFNFL